MSRQTTLRALYRTDADSQSAQRYPDSIPTIPEIFPATRTSQPDNHPWYTWRWQPGPRGMFWTSVIYHVLGLSPLATTPSWAAFTRLALLSDQSRIERGLRRALLQQRGFADDYLIVRPDGRLRLLQLKAYPSDAGPHGVVHYVGTLEDITDLDTGSRSPDQAFCSASIAHELAQPLAAVLLNAVDAEHWLRDSRPGIARARRRIASVVRDAKRATDILVQIRSLLGSEHPPAMLSFNVRRSVESVLRLMRAEIVAAKAHVSVRAASDLPNVLGNPLLTQEVIINLIRNGLQAMEPVTGRPRRLVITIQMDSDRSRVRLGIRDSGVGIGTKVLVRTFQPFYSSKSKGMGIGLALSQHIIARHGGELWAIGNGTRGATLIFTLPVDCLAAIGPAATRAGRPQASGQEVPGIAPASRRSQACDTAK